ncbi:Scd6-like Sm domain-containing protein [Flagelloscypha sp. PMI_526]|nr:Scd6-like Sm domain-containing protein [Flagelloscypha sp. PMI_526]
MASVYIGKLISLTSHSDIRYVGTLAGIDPQASTIQLSNVTSKGTEHRRPAEAFIPPNPTPYQYIVFRAKEVKELGLEPEAPATAQAVHVDPAIADAQQAPPPIAARQPSNPRRQSTGVDGAQRGMDNVERAMNDLQHQPRGIAVPTEDFDFQTSNARFDKTQLSPNPDAAGTESGATPDEDKDKAYDRSKSFFDSFDSAGAPGTTLPSSTPQARHERRVRREEERSRNMSTFGEAVPRRDEMSVQTHGRGWGNSWRGSGRGGAGGRGGPRGRGGNRGGYGGAHPRELRA